MLFVSFLFKFFSQIFLVFLTFKHSGKVKQMGKSYINVVLLIHLFNLYNFRKKCLVLVSTLSELL